MPTITATTTTSYTSDSTGSYDYYVDKSTGGTVWITPQQDVQYDPDFGYKYSRKLRVPRKPTLDEILFDDNYKDKYEEVEVEVDWPDQIQDWKDANKWTTTTSNRTYTTKMTTSI